MVRISYLYSLLFVFPLMAVADGIHETRGFVMSQTQDNVKDTLPNKFYYLDYFKCDMFVNKMAFKIISKVDRTVELTNLNPSYMNCDSFPSNVTTIGDYAFSGSRDEAASGPSYPFRIVFPETIDSQRRHNEESCDKIGLWGWNYFAPFECQKIINFSKIVQDSNVSTVI